MSAPVQAFADYPWRRAEYEAELFVSAQAAAEYVQACAVFDRAVRELGPPHHWPASICDLLCDNMPIPVARARELAALLSRHDLEAKR